MPVPLPRVGSAASVALTLLLLAARCAPAGAGPAPAVAPPPTAAARAEPAAAPPPPVQLRMGFVSLSWSSQLPVAVADELGFLRDEGLEIEPQIVRSGGPVLVAMLLSGEIDVMTSGIEAQLTAIAAGAPAVIVGGMEDRSDYSLVGAPGLRSVEDLRGQTVAATGAGTYSEFAVVEALRRRGLERDRDYTLRSVGNTSLRLAALSAGQVQAVPLDPGDRFHAEDDGFPVLLELRDVIPEFPFSTLTARQELIAQQPGAVVGLLRALSRAQDVIRQDIDRAVALGKAHGLEGDPALEAKVMAYVAPDLHVQLKKENLAALMAARGLTDSPDTVFDDRFLRQAGLAP
ncbi:MAG TPA: ABC transporter substrate-binding protein [Chloroflexota bacterium]|nr:ABC transporter substrate-binding protein [Chloroflexota bacterium]